MKKTLMKKTIRFPFLILVPIWLVLSAGAFAAGNPLDSIPPDSTGMSVLHSREFSINFGRGWNLGNSLEAIGGETAWGNPAVTQDLIDSVKAAGFNAIRIPVAWSRFSDESTYTIDPAWLERVEEVVNFALRDSMYVILNEHWDGGWLQPTYENQALGNERLAAIWHQVALHFRDYDDHLVFAGTNEVMVEGDYGTPKEEYYTVQNGYNQVFVNAVRATGGRNIFRYLAVQGFNTNIDHTISFFDMPGDVREGRLMVEVHYYDPYNFTLNANSSLYVWGADAPGSESWANESWADGQFKKMKDRFVDKGFGVILGEYAAISRNTLGPELNASHARYRRYWTAYITRSILEHGLVPFYWDHGYTGDHSMGLFDRHSGLRVYPEIIEVIMDTSLVESPGSQVGTGSRPETIPELWPNPAGDTIILEVSMQGAEHLVIYDSLGRLVRTEMVVYGRNALDISGLSPGLYYLFLVSPEGGTALKLFKG